MPKHPLDDVFDVDKSPFGDEYDYKVTIPTDKEERDLDLVIELALQQYKQNTEDMPLMTPSGRVKVMEINERILNTIKDAQYKKEVIKINKEKLKIAQEKEKPVAKPASGGPSDVQSEDAPDNLVDRRELFERLRNKK